MNNNWDGVILDSSLKNIKKIKQRDYYWKHNLKKLIVNLLQKII